MIADFLALLIDRCQWDTQEAGIANVAATDDCDIFRNAQALLNLAAQPREATYLALAHVAIAECEIMEREVRQALNSLEKASATIARVNAPLAEWRISSVTAVICEQEGLEDEGALLATRAFNVRDKLAQSLDEKDRLRQSLLDSAAIKDLYAQNNQTR